MDIVELTENEKLEWDEFVLHSGCSVPFQLYAWRKILQEVYGYPYWHLAAKEGSQIIGGLQLFMINSWLIGTTLSSMPGGVCTQNAEVARELMNHARALADQKGALSIIFRDSRTPWGEASQWQSTCSVSIRPLPADADTLKSQLKRQVRQHLNKAACCGVTTASGSQFLEEYYKILAQLMHEKGAPVFSRKFLASITKNLKGHYHITMAFINGTAVGGVFQFIIGDTLFATWGGVPSRFLNTHASYALWWAMMEFGAENGFSIFDMGRSQACSGVEEFKSRWGGKTIPIYDYYQSRRKRPLLHPLADRCGSLKSEILTTSWRHMPTTIVQKLSPHIRWHMPFL